ncbi:MAG: alanine--glyoxylate aminotransferase family protein [Synergistaceae bacterium]|jgi:aspartate aminotransferase-like enzyme|nr:alanine--glyoxylate aminotransferase family protein [Synergistaceae bacterium]
MNKYLMTPGPVPISTRVSLAEARPLIGHRGAEFSTLFKNIEEKLGRLLRSKGRTVIFPSSGTGALESLAVNFAGPDTQVISVSCGVFGDRFREIIALTGAKMINVDVPPGEGVSPEAVASAVASSPDAALLLLTQNETSTGVFNHIDEIVASLPKDKRPLVLVDGVSAVGAMPCYPEVWGIDGLATASQKGLLTPPGLGLVWLSQRAWDHVSHRKCLSYYFDLAQQKKYLDKDAPENPYTPPVSLFTALDAALDEILSNEGWFDLRARAAHSLAAGIEALGFELLVKDQRFRSPGVTAFFYPSDETSLNEIPSGKTSAVTKALAAMGVDVAGGQGQFKGNLIRMSHYHDVRWPEISLALGSLYAALGNAREQAGDFMARALEKWEEK